MESRGRMTDLTRLDSARSWSRTRGRFTNFWQRSSTPRLPPSPPPCSLFHNEHVQRAQTRFLSFQGVYRAFVREAFSVTFNSADGYCVASTARNTHAFGTLSKRRFSFGTAENSAPYDVLREPALGSVCVALVISFLKLFDGKSRCKFTD